MPQCRPDHPLVGAAGSLDDGTGCAQRPQCPLGLAPLLLLRLLLLGLVLDVRGQLPHEPDDAVEGHEEDDGPGGDELGRGGGLPLLPRASADEDLVGDVALGGGDGGEERCA